MKKRLFYHVKGQDYEPQVNLTPLIDVVFVILIMFIVIAPLLEVDRITLAEGGGLKKRAAQEISPLTLHVRADDTLWYQKRKLSVQDLPALFEQHKKQNPKMKPQLFLDTKASFGVYQKIKNSAETAGFEEMDLLLKPL